MLNYSQIARLSPKWQMLGNLPAVTIKLAATNKENQDIVAKEGPVELLGFNVQKCLSLFESSLVA